jgi:hypothetical protein
VAPLFDSGGANVMSISSLRPLILLLFVVVAAPIVIQAQCTQKLTDLPAAPELMGFRLGMTKEEIKTRVPQTNFGRTDHFGVSKTTINPQFDTRIDQTKFAGVRSISLDLLDERLVSLWIGYDETFKTKTIEDFVKLISASLKLNGEWSPWRGRAQQLKCADFQLYVSSIAGSPSLRVLDVGAVDSIAARRQAKEEEDSAVATSAVEEAKREIVGDKHAKVYYPGSCHSAKDITEPNRVVFKSVEEAEKAGYKLARECRGS